VERTTVLPEVVDIQRTSSSKFMVTNGSKRQLIQGATNQLFTASLGGTYTVQETQNGCAGPMSDSFIVVITGLGNP